MAANPAPATGPAAPPDERPLLELVVNIALPTWILMSLSKEERLGPLWALIIAVCLPLGYGIYDAVRRRRLNFYAAIGLVSVLLTGVLGLVKGGAFWFAAKEALIPLILGAAILGSHKTATPFIRGLFLNPQLVNLPLLDRILAADPARAAAFDRLLWQGSLMLAGTMVLSSVANFMLAMHFVGPTEPGSSEYTAAIGKTTAWGFAIIGIPMLAILLYVFWYVVRGLEKVTGLERDDLMNPGQTVRRTVHRGRPSDADAATGRSQAGGDHAANR